MTRYKINDQYFDNLCTPEQSYILGFLWADGHVTKNGYVVNLHVNKREQKIVQYIKDQLCSTHPIKPDTHNRIILNLCSKKLNISLQKLGFVHNKTYAKHIPDYGVCAIAFIRGLLDGDGCIWQSSKGDYNIQITNSKAICEFVKTILKCGNVYPDHSVFKWQVGGAIQVKKLSNILLNCDGQLPTGRKSYKLYQASRIKRIKRKPRLLKLTLEQQKLIQSFSQQGQSCRSIAKQFKVSHTTISKIIKGKYENHYL
jgi:hypothetical protein